MGWTGDDAIKVLNQQVSGIFKDLDLNTKKIDELDNIIRTVKERLRSTSFKHLSFRVVCREDNPVYVLHVGKFYEQRCEPSSNSTMIVSPDIFNSLLNYVQCIKEGKIKRTKYPELHNIVNIPQKRPIKETRETQETQKTKENSKNDDFELDADDATEKITGIIKTRKVVPKVPEVVEISESANVESPVSKTPKNVPKKVSFDDESDDSSQEENKETNDITDTNEEEHTKETSKESIKEPEKKKSSKEVKETQKVESLKSEMPKSEPPKSRREQRKILDDAEESRWDDL